MLPMARFRMAQLELSLLQSGPGAGNADQSAFLGPPDFASWEVLARIFRANGKSTRPAEESVWTAGHLDPCSVGW